MIKLLQHMFPVISDIGVLKKLENKFMEKWNKFAKFKYNSEKILSMHKNTDDEHKNLSVTQMFKLFKYQ